MDLTHSVTALQDSAPGILPCASEDPFAFVKGEKDGSRDDIFVQSKREV